LFCENDWIAKITLSEKRKTFFIDVFLRMNEPNSKSEPEDFSLLVQF